LWISKATNAWRATELNAFSCSNYLSGGVVRGPTVVVIWMEFINNLEIIVSTMLINPPSTKAYRVLLLVIYRTLS